MAWTKEVYNKLGFKICKNLNWFCLLITLITSVCKALVGLCLCVFVSDCVCVCVCVSFSPCACGYGYGPVFVFGIIRRCGGPLI